MSEEVLWREESTPSLDTHRFWYLIDPNGDGVVRGGYFKIRERSKRVDYHPLEINIGKSGAAKEFFQNIKSKKELTTRGSHILMNALFENQIVENETERV